MLITVCHYFISSDQAENSGLQEVCRGKEEQRVAKDMEITTVKVSWCSCYLPCSVNSCSMFILSLNLPCISGIIRCFSLFNLCDLNPTRWAA